MKKNERLVRVKAGDLAHTTERHNSLVDAINSCLDRLDRIERDIEYIWKCSNIRINNI